jgi:ABC-type transporter Mla MlaB component
MAQWSLAQEIWREHGNLLRKNRHTPGVTSLNQLARLDSAKLSTLTHVLGPTFQAYSERTQSNIVAQWLQLESLFDSLDPRNIPPSNCLYDCGPDPSTLILQAQGIYEENGLTLSAIVESDNPLSQYSFPDQASLIRNNSDDGLFKELVSRAGLDINHYSNFEHNFLHALSVENRSNIVSPLIIENIAGTPFNVEPPIRGGRIGR